ncbi:LOW QUALITY PROTEIN: hypothetical protein PanWU01x14_329190 [Parasponia andersonii]|uniref:Uncharacterized protein n=1 Tax=Parasponia andersonii TaxID=3476 RepID=A0A2P5AIJ0_PARAD|nr:LOW QUALITY PROTEIN: hypothetical protein PanWU01x14_329190 [Parasponia andersonii]
MALLERHAVEQERRREVVDRDRCHAQHAAAEPHAEEAVLLPTLGPDELDPGPAELRDAVDYVARRAAPAPRLRVARRDQAPPRQIGATASNLDAASLSRLRLSASRDRRTGARGETAKGGWNRIICAHLFSLLLLRRRRRSRRAFRGLRKGSGSRGGGGLCRRRGLSKPWRKSDRPVRLGPDSRPCEAIR